MSSQKPYSNITALLALTRASLQAILKSPSAIVFGIAFPLIFILVFGFLGGGGGGSRIQVAIPRGSDTTSPFYHTLAAHPALHLHPNADPALTTRAMMEGDIAASLRIEYQPKATPVYHLSLTGASISPQQVAQLREVIRQAAAAQDPEIARRTEDQLSMDERTEVVREYKTIDFVLPGQLGFSLMAGAIFGTAFVFFNLRQTLVLKRFFATPVRRSAIVVGEALARLVFQLLTAVIIILIGHLVFGFTLVHGAATFAALLGLSALASMVFMGFGFIISSAAKNESSIPPFSNLITLPQFLLAGTFFPIGAFPKWLQPIAKVLPLTYLNDAMRQVAFYGEGFGAIKWDLLALGIWGVVLYAVAAKIFKWE